MLSTDSKLAIRNGSRRNKYGISAGRFDDYMRTVKSKKVRVRQSRIGEVTVANKGLRTQQQPRDR